ncbi:MAG: SDR family oxidoreductase [Gammaproteobacteria bacterium]|nr:SDR family oxidoreductase [Gammaproteobacteria bacterium]MDH3812030.1 SDR family oxidoreductase [Gammaproteobacteria bacterium]
MDISNKTIAITGGGRGLGAAMATRLATEGARLALVDLDEEALAATATACTAAGSPQVAIYKVNVADEDEVVALFDNIAADFGALHGLVNNAGITRDALTLKYKNGEQVSKMSLDQWKLVIDVNLTGVFLCGREAAEKMIELGCEGCLINISSISRAGNMGQVNYSATKAGVEAMAVVWAKEFARYGLRAASVAPGFIGTDMVMAMKPEAREKLTAGIPLRRVGDPDEIAKTVQFIFENDYISGRCFEIDGALRL